MAFFSRPQLAANHEVQAVSESSRGRLVKILAIEYLLLFFFGEVLGLLFGLPIRSLNLARLSFKN